MEYADDIFGPGTKDRFHQYRSKVDGYPQFHEFAGKEILDHLLNESVFAGVSAVLVEAIFAARSGKTWMSCLHSIIDGQMDVDRLDYIRRDALRAGTENHAIDQERLLESTELHIEANGQWAVGVGARALSAVETLLLQRAQSYRWVIHNSRAIVSDACLKRAFAIALERSIIHNDTAYGDRPDLDYVSSWRPDSHCVPTSYEVDDGTVRRWLRQCRRNASNSRDALSSKFLACMRVADESSTAYKPAWKTYGDFHTALSQYIGRGDELAKDLAMALRLNSDSTAGAILIEDEAIVTDTAALQFNRLIKKIAEARPDAAQDIEDDLNQSVTDVGGIPGIWVVSYISSIKAYNREKTKLWIGDTEYYLDELSPIPAALSAADLMRPIIWPFFISFDEKDSETRCRCRGFCFNRCEIAQKSINYVRSGVLS